MTIEDARGPVTREAEADDQRRLIDRIDKTIVALLYERLRLGSRLDQLQDPVGGKLEDAHERRR